MNKSRVKKFSKSNLESNQRKLKNKIKTTFLEAGFEFIDTENHKKHIGRRDIEIDEIFIYKNILIVCEDTCTTNDIKTHIRNKAEAFKEITNNKTEFLGWIKKEFSSSSKSLTEYSDKNIVIKFLYFSYSILKITDEDKDNFQIIQFVQPYHLEYFNRLVKCIHYSAKYEIFRFLGISNDELGIYSSEEKNTSIPATIICPQETIGTKEGVNVVSFMMSAETLIRNSYVLRKDNWEDIPTSYQRLLIRDKIKSIRKFLIEKKESFYNNIIVALPSDVFFQDSSQKSIDLSQVCHHKVCTMFLPDKMNTICIIDGQHRVFAHYEGNLNDKDEKIMKDLRRALHLLVTGLVFPKNMSSMEKSRVQSEIFLDINSNAKPVASGLLLHIKSLQNPLSDVGLARAVIDDLNSTKLFMEMFESSPLHTGKIKITSIIKFALRYIVALEPKEKKNLYTFWTGDKEELKNVREKNDQAYLDYVKFCSDQLVQYFNAVKESFPTDWESDSSKILSVISLNGFLLAFLEIINTKGIQKFEYYKLHFQNLNISFSKDEFPYTSSRYRKFSQHILAEAFPEILPDTKGKS